MGYVSQGSATHTNGMYLCDIISNGAKCRHGTEWDSSEVHIETCDDDSDSFRGQLVAHIDKVFVEELGFIDTDDIAFVAKEQDAGRIIDGRGVDSNTLVGHHIVVGIACVDSRLEYLHFLMCKLCTLHTTDQFFGLT